MDHLPETKNRKTSDKHNGTGISAGLSTIFKAMGRIKNF